MNHDIREALHNLLSVMEMQEKRQSGEFHISGETFMGMWSDAKHNARQALAALEREEYRCERCQQPMRFNVPRLGPNGGFVHSDTGSLDCATPPAAEREGADAAELKAWREMFAAFAASGLPASWPNPNPKLWPNQWPQDVAMVAFALHRAQAPADAQDAARYRWLRSRDLDTISKGGVFAGMTPENVVLNGPDLDAAIDKQRGAGEGGNG